MRLLAPAVALVALLAPVPAMAQHWYRLVKTADVHTYVDADSVKPKGDLFVANETMVLREADSQAGFKFVRTIAEYDCRKQSVHFVRFTAFNTEGVQIESLDDPDNGASHTPPAGSPGTFALTFICGDRSKGVAVADPLKDAF